MTARFIPRWQRTLMTAIVLIGLIAFLMPLWWNIVWATWHANDIFLFPPKLLPGPYLLDNLMRLQERINIVRVFTNSLIVSGVSVAGALFFCTLAGFAFAKYSFRFSTALFFIVLATLAIPSQVTAIPLYILMISLGWVDTYRAIIVPGLVPAFGVFFMRQSAQEAIPTELLEAARIDGANEIQNFFNVAVPNLLPHIAALSIFMFAGSWGSLFWPLIVIRSPEMFTLPIALSGILGQYERGHDILMAGALLAIIPPLFMFLLMQRHFTKSLIAGAFK